MTKWIIGLGVLVVVGVGLWWSGVFSSLMPKTTPAVVQQATSTDQAAQPAAPVSDLPTQGSDNSDAALVQDSAAVDTQMQSLASDQANLDSSMNDKPVSQEY